MTALSAVSLGDSCQNKNQKACEGRDEKLDYNKSEDEDENEEEEVYG